MTHSYADEVGNRLAMGADGEVTSYTYDPGDLQAPANRLTNVGDIEYDGDDGDRWVAWQPTG